MSGAFVTFYAIPESSPVIEVVWRRPETDLQVAEIEQGSGDADRMVRLWLGTDSFRFPLMPVLALLSRANVVFVARTEGDWTRSWSAEDRVTRVRLKRDAHARLRGSVDCDGEEWSVSFVEGSEGGVVEIPPDGTPLPLRPLIRALMEASVRLEESSSFTDVEDL